MRSPSSRSFRPDLRDLTGGALSAAFGAGAYLKSRSYDFGSPLRMGPGFFPAVLGILIFFFGLALMARATIARNAGRREFKWRPAIAIPAGIGAFAVLLERAGLAPATLALVLIASLAEPNFRPLRTLVLALAVLAMIYVIFILILRMPIEVLA